MKESLTKMNYENWSKPEYRDKMTKILNCKGTMMKFLYRQGEDCVATLYLGWNYNNTFKFGITGNPDIRRRRWVCRMKTIHKLMIGNKYQISFIECKLKEWNNVSEHVNGNMLSEFLNKFREIKETAKSITCYDDIKKLLD